MRPKKPILILWIVITLAILSSGQEWAWNKVAEPNCDNCRCLGEGLPFTDPRIQSILSKPTYDIFANQQIISVINLITSGKKASDATLIESCIVAQKIFLPNGNFANVWGDGKMNVSYTCKPLAKTGSRVASCKIHSMPTSSRMSQVDTRMYEAYRDGPYKTSVPWTDGTTTVRTICFGKRQHSAYIVVSQRTQLKKGTKKVVLAVLANIGFDMSKMRKYNGVCQNIKSNLKINSTLE